MKTQYHHTFPDAIQYTGKPLPYAFKILLFFGVNGVLALLMPRVPGLATLHVYLTIIIGGLILLTSEKPYHLVYWLGYVVASELVWRATGANTFWETGKYALIAFSALWVLKFKGEHRPEMTLIPYFFLLVPSITLLPFFDRQAISFALAGPFAIVVTSIMFSQLNINRAHLKNLLLMTLAGVLIFSVLALVGVINAETIDFTSASMSATSANTGPNQASSVLSLGAFVAILFVTLEKEDTFLRVVVLLIGLGLITQMLLTFSRGGMWTLAGALVAGGIFFIRDNRARTAFIFTSAVLLMAMNLYIMPALDSYTAGSVGDRFADTSTTGRVEILRSDLDVFRENLVFGVGPGRSNPYHARYFRVAHAHTEFSRMLSEHGLFGALSLLILLITLVKKVFQKTALVNRAVVAACIVWGMLFMAHSATRLAAPSFLIGLAFAHFNMEEGPDPASSPQEISRPYQKLV